MRHFSYSRAESIDQAVATFSENQHTSFLAGGTNLLDMVKLDIIRPELMIDVNRLNLNQIEVLEDQRLKIGAMVSNSMLAHHAYVKEKYTVLSEALLSGASTQLRNKATTGGNVMQRVRVLIFGITPRCATNVIPVQVVQQLRASTVLFTLCWAQAIIVSPVTLLTCVWRWQPLGRASR